MATRSNLRTAFDGLVTAVARLSVADQPAPIPGRRVGVAAKATQLAQPAVWAAAAASSPLYDNVIALLNAAVAALANRPNGLLAALEQADDALDALAGALGA
ncbi:MAG TPA: hypothetical protein VMG08_12295 [Allosphingosinicella sp.]|nr:hypothetical protein [Allosphingosinicella sp.]